jgi:hypothetical protein
MAGAFKSASHLILTSAELDGVILSSSICMLHGNRSTNLIFQSTLVVNLSHFNSLTQAARE